MRCLSPIDVNSSKPVDHWCVPKWLDNPSMLRDMRKVISFYQNLYKKCLLGLFSVEITQIHSQTVILKTFEVTVAFS